MVQSFTGYPEDNTQERLRRMSTERTSMDMGRLSESRPNQGEHPAQHSISPNTKARIFSISGISAAPQLMVPVQRTASMLLTRDSIPGLSALGFDPTSGGFAASPEAPQPTTRRLSGNSPVGQQTGSPSPQAPLHQHQQPPQALGLALSMRLEPPPLHTTSSASTDSVVREIYAIYQRVNPAKLADLPAMLERNNGSEARLLEEIKKKYNIAPGAPTPARHPHPPSQEAQMSSSGSTGLAQTRRL